MNRTEREARHRLKTDFEYYTQICLRIRSKAGTIIPLKLNEGQKQFFNHLQDQKKRTGKVRLIVLKGRQMGLSTVVEANLMWKITHNQGVKGYVLTHVSSSTAAIFDMTKRYYEMLPAFNKPEISKNNSHEIVFPNLQSSIKVSTAGSTNTGRGETIQYAHFSEVAFWPNPEEIVKGLQEAIPDLPGTEIIMESTANGASGYFYDECMKALKGIGDFELVFIPWFWQSEYRRETNIEFTQAERDYQKTHNLDDKQLAWRQAKIIQMGSANFRQEYPSTPEEAFQADVDGALWTNKMIDKTRVLRLPKNLVRIVVGVDPAITSNANSDETGIVVVGIDDEGHIYILDDLSGNFPIEVWAKKVIQAYNEWGAGAIIAETNQGGDLVKSAIRAVDPTANILGKHVSVSKQMRHEPVSALYSRLVVHHVGSLPELERQMVTWSPSNKKVSPDRVDAMTLAVAELGLKKIREQLDAIVI